MACLIHCLCHIPKQTSFFPVFLLALRPGHARALKKSADHICRFSHLAKCPRIAAHHFHTSVRPNGAP